MRVSEFGLLRFSGLMGAGIVCATNATGFVVPVDYMFRADSYVEVDTAPFDSDSFAIPTGLASTVAFFGGPAPAPDEVRTAARCGVDQMTANATYDGRKHPTTLQLLHGESSSEYRGRVLIGAGPREVLMEFFLPPGFLELRTNPEAADLSPMKAEITADIVILPDYATPRDQGAEMFVFNALLQGGHYVHSVTTSADSADPALDVGPLTHTDLSIDDQGSTQTILWEYDAFNGVVSLGDFGPGEIVVSYLMTATVEGGNPAQGATGAINDPFFFTGDPILGSPVTFWQVPEPASIFLGALGVVLLRRRQCRGVRF